MALVGRRHNGTECSHSIEHKVAGMWQINLYTLRNEN